MFDINKIRAESCTEEKGIALITVMLMLAVMTVLAITMFNTSAVETLISSNYRTSKEAFFDADAGVQYALAKVSSSLNDKTLKISNLDGYALNSLDLSNLEFNFSFPDPLSKNGNSYCFLSQGQGSNNASATIEACFKIDTHPAFNEGILADNNISIGNNANIIGSVHSNAIADVKTNDVTGTVTDSTDPNFKPVPVPKVLEYDGNGNMILPWTQDDIDRWESEGKTVVVHSGGLSTPSTENTISDKVILVEGDATISGNTTLKNVTLIVTGDITFDGRSQNDDGVNKNAIIAGGNITFNGNSDSYAVFWSDGSFIMNGGGTVYGSIVSSGVTDINGKLYFEYDSSIDNDLLPVVPISNYWADTSLVS
jgi:hypothetical protein